MGARGPDIAATPGLVAAPICQPMPAPKAAVTPSPVPLVASVVKASV